MSKTTNILFFIYLVNLFLLSDAGKLIPRSSEEGFSYRVNLFQNPDKNQTLLHPDSNSSPLRVTREELGRFTWAFLHSVAAAYPIQPTDEDKHQISNLLHSIPYLYPCKVCAGHFSLMLSKYPIKSDSRSDLIGYMCFLHNQVNERLHKPIFDCKLASNYWGGDCGCDKKEPTNSLENK